MDDINMGVVWKAIQTAGRILNDRILRVLALLMAFALFVIAILAGTWVALAVASAFAVIVFIPCLVKTGRAQLPGESEDGT